MPTYPLQGHYTLLEETPNRLLFTRTPRQRCSLGLALGALTLTLLAVAMYSLLRPRQDVGGFVAFLIFGIISAGAMLFYSASWIEIEFDRPRREVVRRRVVMGKLWRSEALPFEQVKRVTVKTSPGDVSDAYYVEIVRPDNLVWAFLSGYLTQSQAVSIRQKIVELMA